MAIICWFVPVKLEITLIIFLFGIVNTGLTVSILRKAENKDNYIKNKEALSTIRIRLNNFNYILSVAMILEVNLHKCVHLTSIFSPLFLVVVLFIGNVFLEKFELFVIKEFKKHF